MSTLKTALTELVGITHPVVQTGMGWVAGARLVAATSSIQFEALDRMVRELLPMGDHGR